MVIYSLTASTWCVINITGIRCPSLVCENTSSEQRGQSLENQEKGDQQRKRQRESVQRQRMDKGWREEDHLAVQWYAAHVLSPIRRSTNTSVHTELCVYVAMPCVCIDCVIMLTSCLCERSAGRSAEVREDDGESFLMMMMMPVPSDSNSSHGLRGEQSPVWTWICVIKDESTQRPTQIRFTSFQRWPQRRQLAPSAKLMYIERFLE